MKKSYVRTFHRLPGRVGLGWPSLALTVLIVALVTTSPAANAEAPPVEQAGASIQATSGEVLLTRSDGCVTTELYFAAGSGHLAGFPYASGRFGDFGVDAGEHFDVVGIGLMERDECANQLLRSWGLISWAGSVGGSHNVVHAVGTATVSECDEIAGACQERVVEMDVTWTIGSSAGGNQGDTTNDIHESGVVSNQGGATLSANVCGEMDGSTLSSWTLVFAQANVGHQVGLVHNPVP